MGDEDAVFWGNMENKISVEENILNKELQQKAFHQFWNKHILVLFINVIMLNYKVKAMVSSGKKIAMLRNKKLVR